MAHIGADELGFRAGGAQLGDESGSCVVVATGGNNLCPFPGKGKSGGAGDAGKRTGDQDYGRIHIISFRNGRFGWPYLVCLAGPP
jgi:hypothetical protein